MDSTQQTSYSEKLADCCSRIKNEIEQFLQSAKNVHEVKTDSLYDVVISVRLTADRILATLYIAKQLEKEPQNQYRCFVSSAPPQFQDDSPPYKFDATPFSNGQLRERIAGHSAWIIGIDGHASSSLQEYCDAVCARLKASPPFVFTPEEKFRNRYTDYTAKEKDSLRCYKGVLPFEHKKNHCAVQVKLCSYSTVEVITTTPSASPCSFSSSACSLRYECMIYNKNSKTEMAWNTSRIRPQQENENGGHELQPYWLDVVLDSKGNETKKAMVRWVSHRRLPTSFLEFEVELIKDFSTIPPLLVKATILS